VKNSVPNDTIGSSDGTSGVAQAKFFGANDGTTGGAATGLAPRPVVGRIPPKLYRMGEVVEYSGLSRQTIHNYATMGLLRESRWTAGGHRLFDECVFGRLDQIARMKRRNKTMREIREHFSQVEQS